MNRPGRILKIGFLGTLLAVTFIFSFFKVHDLVVGMDISIEAPENGETLRDPFVIIRGKAPGSSFLSINDAKVLTDQSGYFEKEILLGLGYNVIKVKALDRFNREKTKSLELVYKPISNNNDSLVSNKF